MIDVEELQPTVGVGMVYDIPLIDFVQLSPVIISNQSVHDGDIHRAHVKLPVYYEMAIDLFEAEMPAHFENKQKNACKENRRNLIATLFARGFSELQHIYEKHAKQIHKVRIAMIREDYVKAERVYYCGNKRQFPNEETMKGRVHVCMDSKSGFPPAMVIAKAYSKPASEVIILSIGYALLAWDELPEKIRWEIERDLQHFKKTSGILQEPESASS